MLSKELEYTLNSAFRDARDKRHEFLTVEHLLLHGMQDLVTESGRSTMPTASYPVRPSATFSATCAVPTPPASRFGRHGTVVESGHG